MEKEISSPSNGFGLIRTDLFSDLFPGLVWMRLDGNFIYSFSRKAQFKGQ